MDIQLLVRLGRMMPPRTLALSADIAAAKAIDPEIAAQFAKFGL